MGDGSARGNAAYLRKSCCEGWARYIEGVRFGGNAAAACNRAHCSF